jgi:hypothetical protein
MGLKCDILNTKIFFIVLLKSMNQFFCKVTFELKKSYLLVKHTWILPILAY